MFLFSSFFLLVCGLVSAIFLHFEWVTLAQLGSLVFGCSALSSLLAVIILPWNLYFEAKEIQQEQKISSNKEIQLEEDDLEFTRRLPAKMLALALSLHLAGSAASYFLYSVAQVYWCEYLAWAFLLSTIIRPLSALHQNLMRRLSKIRKRTFVPRKDSLHLEESIKLLQEQLENLRLQTQESSKQTHLIQQETSSQLELLEKKTRENARTMDNKVDTILGEFERSLTKIQANQEILNGLKALVKMVKAS